MSIPRDLRVPLPNGTTGKINAAYNGGPGATAGPHGKVLGH